MSLDSTLYTLSNVNALLGSFNGYTQAKADGIGTGAALAGFGLNVMNGAMRNAVAKDIQETSGSYLGYAVNSLAGYGNAEANAKGTAGLIGASLLTSPFGIFGCNSFMTPPMFGFAPFGGGCCCGPSAFGMRGFWC